MSCVEQRALDDAEASPLGATTFIAKTSECSSPKDILCLSLTLKTPMTVVGPATITHLAPRTAAAGRILEALASLSTATDVTIYLPSNPDSCGQADTLCNMVNSGKAQAIPNDYALDMLYHGAGGHILTSLLARFDRQQPPSYQSLSGNEAERPLKRPRQSPSMESDSKEFSVEARVEAATQPLRAQLSRVTAELADLRNQVQPQLEAGTPTEDASVADHLDRLDTEVRELREGLERVEESVRVIERRTYRRLKVHFGWRFDQWQEEAVEETIRAAGENVESEVIGLREELQAWAASELRDLVQSELDEVVERVMEESHFSFHRARA